MSTNIRVDFHQPACGKIRPLHGVNSGPMTKVFTYDARPLFLEAGFPYARLHDVEYPYGSGEFVDIPCIFRNFDADETKEENYNFDLTDEYIRHIIEVGCQPLFRLGISIEHAPVKRYVYPPKDYRKWARICEHIIRHYNEGWANGFHWDIRYWEIWNEADGSGCKMWGGTPEEFYELYVVSATYLKEKFPELMIGGCGYTKATNPFIEGFFRYISTRDHKVPLDFYSWHRYFDDIGRLMRSVSEASALMEKYGYGDAESVLDEWNYMESWDDQAESYRKMKNHVGAAHAGAVLCALQREGSVAIANYFESDVVKEFCGIFNVKDMAISRKCATLCPTKTFYPFYDFNRLYRLGDEIPAASDSASLYVCAAKGAEGAALMAVNYGGEDREICFDLTGLDGMATVWLTDEEHTHEKLMELAGGETLTLKLLMKNNSVIYIGTVK